jgi:hypothetical protein
MEDFVHTKDVANCGSPTGRFKFFLRDGCRDGSPNSASRWQDNAANWAMCLGSSVALSLWFAVKCGGLRDGDN